MIKLNKKQRKALRNNAKRHARKQSEHRRRISAITEGRLNLMDLHYLNPHRRWRDWW